MESTPSPEPEVVAMPSTTDLASNLRRFADRVEDLDEEALTAADINLLDLDSAVDSVENELTKVEDTLAEGETEAEDEDEDSEDPEDEEEDEED